jgi:hypothetical protein
MSDSGQSVQLSFRHTEQEYLAAVRYYVWHSKELLLRMIVFYVLVSIGMVLLLLLIDVPLPLWVIISFIVLAGVASFQGYLVDLPRRYFRGDPKFRDEYTLTFTDAGIEFRTTHLNASLAWSLYTDVIENDKLYILVYGKGINTLSILPKRAFTDDRQETAFRQLLRRHVDHNLKLSAGEREGREYFPPAQPPDWR